MLDKDEQKRSCRDGSGSNLSSDETAANFRKHSQTQTRVKTGTTPVLELAFLATTIRYWCCIISLVGVIILIEPAQSFYIDERQSPQTSEWNYNEQFRWAQQHRGCSGRAQSPIDIQHKNVISSQHLRLQFYNYNKPLKFKLSNAHHTIKMNPTGLAAYDQGGADQHQHSGSGRFNQSNSAHDMITADEYVDFSSVSSPARQHQHQGATDNEHLSKLVAVGGQNGDLAAPKASQNKKNKNSNHNQEREHEAAIGLGNSLLVEEPLHGLTPPPPETNSHRDEPYEGAPTIKLDWLDDGNNEYKLRDIHFHWGERRDNGSEHAIDGRRAAMEMHLVHIKHGLDKSKIGFTSDSVSVIAILIESHRKSNADFNPIVNELVRINSTEQPREIDYKSIYDLLPSNLQAFYTYSGSLTTPPCYQVVNWIVMAERLNMNAKQIEMFRNLYAPPHESSDEEHPGPAAAASGDEDEGTSGGNRLGGSEHDGNSDKRGRQSHSEHEQSLASHHVDMIMPNVRMVQPLNNRTILASFTKYGSRLEAASANLYAATGDGVPSAIHQHHSALLCSAVLLTVQTLIARFSQTHIG